MGSAHAQTEAETPTPHACHRHTETSFHCVQYLKNYDGDTLRVRIPGVHPMIGQNMSIRLRGVDTPEIRTRDDCEKRAALKAKSFVEERLSKAQRIDLHDVGRGKYFRFVAQVEVDGEDLSELLLNHGLALPYQGKTKPKGRWCDP